MGQEIMVKDPLTGLNSRAHFKEVLHGEIKRAKRNDREFSLMLLDLDHFKSINDAFGHTRGDQVLIEFGLQRSVSTHFLEESANVRPMYGQPANIVRPRFTAVSWFLSPSSRSTTCS